MIKNIEFEVEGKKYYIPENYAELSSFEVSSSPRNYQVVWDDCDNPEKTVMDIFFSNPKNILIADKNVYKLYFEKLNVDLDRLYLVDAVEENKNMDTVLDFVSFLEKNGFTKGETLVAVGGGIVEDIAAFVGAAYKRGINWVFFPTTLLSMCDSCIGGKTGINYHKVKNQMALFSAPRKVFVNPNFLKTLHEREVKSGLGEILKLFVTAGEDLINIYEKYVINGCVPEFGNFRYLILGALWTKKAIIEDDEFEFNIRKSLNYGHTLGHAFEVLTNYKIPHGQAVALGMLIVNRLSVNRSLLDEKTHLRIRNLIKDLLDAQDIKSINTANLMDLIQKDKKTVGNTTTFVIIESMGNTKFLNLELSAVVWDEINNAINEEVKC